MHKSDGGDWRFDHRNIYWGHLFRRVFCKNCGHKMKFDDDTYNIVYRCPNCNWLTFHKRG